MISAISWRRTSQPRSTASRGRRLCSSPSSDLIFPTSVMNGSVPSPPAEPRGPSVPLLLNRRLDDARLGRAGDRPRPAGDRGEGGGVQPRPRSIPSISASKIVRRERGVTEAARRCRGEERERGRELARELGRERLWLRLLLGSALSVPRKATNSSSSIHCWQQRQWSGVSPTTLGDQTVAVLTRSPLASTRSKSRQIVASDTVALAWPPRPPTRPLLLPPRAPSLPVVRSACDHSSMLSAPSPSRSSVANSRRAESLPFRPPSVRSNGRPSDRRGNGHKPKPTVAVLTRCCPHAVAHFP